MATPILSAHRVCPAGSWSGAAADAVVLDFEARHRRRVTLTTRQGRRFLLDLAEVPSLQQGDALLLDDGDLIEVQADDEALLEVTAADTRTLARLAWHLGNRHLPTEVDGHTLRIREDHVIEAMLQGLGADVRHVQRPFHPEGGAYGHGRTHGHDHHHHDAQDHDHDHDAHEH